MNPNDITCWTRTIGPFSRVDCGPNWWWWASIALLIVVLVLAWLVNRGKEPPR